MEESSVKIEIPGWLTLPARLRSLLTVYFSDAYLCYKPTYTLDGDIQFIGYTIRSSAQSLYPFDEEFETTRWYEHVPMILPTYTKTRPFIDVDPGSDDYQINDSESLGYPANINSSIMFDQWVVYDFGSDGTKYSEEDLPGVSIRERMLCTGVSSAPGMEDSTRMIPYDLIEIPPEDGEVRAIQIALPDNKLTYERRTVSFIIQTSDGVEHSVHYKMGVYANDRSFYKVSYCDDYPEIEIDREYNKDNYQFSTNNMLAGVYVTIKQFDYWDDSRNADASVYGINISSSDLQFGYVPDGMGAEDACCVGEYITKSGYKPIPNKIILPAWNFADDYHHFVGWGYLMLYNDDGTLFDTDLQINGIRLYDYEEFQTALNPQTLYGYENGTIISGLAE